MGKQSGFLLKQELRERDLIIKAQGIIIQYMLDTLQVTLREDYGKGYDSIMDLMDKWTAKRKYYQAVLEPRNPEADVMREHMQRVLRDIGARKKIVPPEFDDRYPFLNRIKYDRRYK